MTRLVRLIWLIFFLILAVGCQAKLYHYTDPKYQVSVSYPGNLSLVSEKETLDQVVEPAEPDAIDRPELLFVVASPGQSRLSCSVHHLPEGVSLTADEYYEASTAQEIQQLNATIVDPKADVTINGRVYQRVGFLAKVDEMTNLHVRIYQHLDGKTSRVLVLTSMIEVSAWDTELALMEPVINSLRLDW